MKFTKKMKYVSTDGWRGFYQPECAVFGTTDTGTWSDSPCPSDEAEKEIKYVSSLLRKNGFHVRSMYGKTSNVFAMKRYVIVPEDELTRAKAFAEKAMTEDKFLRSSNLWVCS